MLPPYIDKETVIATLKTHLTETDKTLVDWEAVIADGEIYPHKVNGIEGCFIYSVRTPSNGFVTEFLHPITGSIVDYDPFVDKEVYMGRKEGVIPR